MTHECPTLDFIQRSPAADAIVVIGIHAANIDAGCFNFRFDTASHSGVGFVRKMNQVDVVGCSRLRSLLKSTGNK